MVPLVLLSVGRNSRVRRRILVTGIVQGVGFRPFAHSLATRLRLGGFVANDSSGVRIEVEGSTPELDRFIERLEIEAPPLAIIQSIHSEPVSSTGEQEFHITASRHGGEHFALISPEIATCVDCLREMFDATDRRYRYPFTNCTNCGPRFTIIQEIPYDRAFTTMARFEMCSDCAREYNDPGNRRFHAQPVCCPACGPGLKLTDRKGIAQQGDSIPTAAELLQSGHIIAVKGLGGYHLAAVASSEFAVAALRSRKYREDKPFAIMVADLAMARRLAEVDEAERRVLAGSRRPIVLLRRRAEAPIAQPVAPGNRSLGVMLPYTPLHHLLCREVAEPLVLTSGNVSDEPIAYTDEEAFERLSSIADYFLTHDRAINTRVDDSVVRVFRGQTIPIRRSRGYAPLPLRLPWKSPRAILGCGAELKSTFCLMKDDYAFISQHIGDLENFETFSAYVSSLSNFQRLFDVTPEIVAHDLHPEYLSAKHAVEMTGVELIGVQHHHAHVASCLADNGEQGPVIGVAFDGLGYGADGTMWGGEFLIADLLGFERVGSFEAAPMPGGTAAIKQPWRMAAAYLARLFPQAVPAEFEVRRRNHAQWDAITRMVRLHSPLTSSAGRLFDAVAAILGVRDIANYEGQAAIELEQRAAPDEASCYEIAIGAGPPWTISSTATIQAIVNDLSASIAIEIIAARFHNTIAALIAALCDAIRAQREITTVALTGGVFQNQLLLTGTVHRLELLGFRVLTHHQVPTNDAGISLGQAAIAAAVARQR
jgi:hydrogenase maturation protein HypF